MKALTYATMMLFAAFAFATRAGAQIVYTPVNVQLPVNGSYGLDLDHDGTTDFTLRSPFLQAWCVNGDEDSWSLEVLASNANVFVISLGHVGSPYASALPAGVSVGSDQAYGGDFGIMAEIFWGGCGTGSDGPWLNVPDRYLGLQFQTTPDKSIHDGWAKVATVAYVDRQGHLHAATMISGFAYETMAGRPILTGQTSE
jgi:hypothetical protein